MSEIESVCVSSWGGGWPEVFKTYPNQDFSIEEKLEFHIIYYLILLAKQFFVSLFFFEMFWWNRGVWKTNPKHP